MVWPMNDSDQRLDRLARLIATSRRTAWRGGDDERLHEKCYNELVLLGRTGTPLERAICAAVLLPADLPDNPPGGRADA